MQPIIAVQRISKCFQRGNAVLRDVSFSIEKGEMVALIGASGSGKSTLIRAIAGLTAIDRPCDGVTGSISVFGRRIQNGVGAIKAPKNVRTRIGVIFQQFNLVPRLSVLTNVCLGLLGRLPVIQGTLGRFNEADQRKAIDALSRVGMAEHALKRGVDLSGGQQQRAAIARCLVQQAEILIADEPIASLDPGSARRVMDTLADMNRRDGITVIVSLHQVEYALKYCPRTIALKAGKIVYDGPSSALSLAVLSEIYGAEAGDLFLPSLQQQSAPPATQTKAPAIVSAAQILQERSTFNTLAAARPLYVPPPDSRLHA